MPDNLSNDGPAPEPDSSGTGTRLAVTAYFPWLLVLIAMLAPLAMTAFVPALPLMADDLLVSTENVQLVLSVSLLATAVASLLYGQIADVFGRRPALILGFGVAAIGSVMATFGATIEMIVAGRTLQAVGAGSAYVLVRVLVHDVYVGSRAIAILGFSSAAIAVAPIVGPLMGGVISDTLGWRWIFLSVGFMAILLMFACFFFLPETRDPLRQNQNASADRRWIDLLKRPDYLRHVFAGTAVLAGFYAYVSGAPYLMIQGYGMSATTYGLCYVTTPFAYLIGSLMAGKLASTIRSDSLCLLGIVGVVSFSLIAFLWCRTSELTPLALFGSMFGMALFAGIGLPAAQAGLVDAAHERPGVASGIFTFIHMIISAVVAQTVGVKLANGFGSAAVTVPMLTVTLMGLVGYVGFSWRVRQSAVHIGSD